MGIGYIYARITEDLLEGESILRVIIKHLDYHDIISGFLALWWSIIQQIMFVVVLQ